MPQRPWSEFLAGLTPLSGGKPVLHDVLAKLKRAPAIYWYPGSGGDLTPLVFDVPNNPVGRRLFRLSDLQASYTDPIVLWMNDYSDQYASFPQSPVIRTEYGDHIAIGRHQERFIFEEKIPVTLFSATVTNHDQGIHARPQAGDRYLVIYSNCASHELLRQVLLPFAVRPVCVALIRQGGFSRQLYYEQYIDIPAWLAEHEKTLGGPVDLYVIDAYGQDLELKRPLADAIAHYDYRGGPVPWGWSPCRAFGRPNLIYGRQHKSL